MVSKVNVFEHNHNESMNITKDKASYKEKITKGKARKEKR